MAGSLHAQITESLTPGRVFSSLFIVFVGLLILDHTWKPTYPENIPVVGYGKGTVARFKNFYYYMFRYRDWVIEGYKKYNKQNRAFVVPAAASRAPDIILPQSLTKWLLEYPDSVVSAHEAHNDVLYSDYNFLGKVYADDVWHTLVIHKSLARHLSTLIPAIEEEVSVAVDEAFGTNTEDWKTLNLWDAWLTIVPPVTNRMLVGEGVCRTKEFCKAMVSFVDQVILNCFALHMVPQTILPILGPLIALPNWWLWRKASKHSLPVIRKRLDDMAKKEAGDPAYESWVAPEDFITWDIRMAKAEKKFFELDPYVISKRLLPIQFAAIHTTVITGHSIVLDLLSSDPAKGYIEGIREEAERVLREEGGSWTKNGLSRLYRLDSAIRESQRLSNFSCTLMERKVIAKEGITNEQEGWHLPRGTFLTVNLEGLHHDDELNPNAREYDAFRTSRKREEYEAKPQSDRNLDEGLRLKNLGMVTTSDAHLPFGHGRHACPGRFFVAHELKMVVANLFLNYDVKPLAERPKHQWVGVTVVPPVDAKIELKRRKGTV
ncbi:cytochrome P450 [Colletotrichum paranaense]|uniref:Cytochrome P450 n=3 Tax=Colletotrichum acutatum species complex TaxID=2707335 RepID=A0A9P9XJP7_9PEZI|nr:cytochrome P450 [Colletotrichum paranaense]XP_060392156.1 cytochrome P450 [Colletotrichum abscissum]KAI3536949.1 cytochrome P450 [Colletotrichum filicis]KAK1463141.1 cytochrome P450 [Colletotrichum melonis]KAI3554608.1 cytochrome P450 [Colletotrichum abscissum]KAK1477099.1 cytochrome P450 [Colletotrichum abscissum]KAK1527826.1 cytochrome P450 [Colletotrichum paranaense]